MNTNHKNHTQFELFPGSSDYNAETGKIASQIKSLTLSLENIIVLCIIFVVMLVLIFSFGVEQGKKVVARASVIDKSSSSALEILEDDAAIVANDTIGSNENSVSKIIIEQDMQEQEVSEVPKEIIENIKSDIFTIQVASFKQETSAKREADRLKDVGTDVFVLPKGSYSIVCVGKFAQIDEARAFSNKLKDHYGDLLVRRF